MIFLSRRSSSPCCERHCCEKHSMMRSLGDLFNGDLVAEGFEALDEAVLEGVLVAAVEEVGAEVVVGAAILEEMVGDDQDRVGDGDGGLVGATASGEAMVLGAEVGVAGATGGLGSLDQGGPQRTVAL